MELLGCCLLHPRAYYQIVQEHCAETSTEICVVPLMAKYVAETIPHSDSKFIERSSETQKFFLEV